MKIGRGMESVVLLIILALLVFFTGTTAMGSPRFLDDESDTSLRLNSEYSPDVLKEDTIIFEEVTADLNLEPIIVPAEPFMGTALTPIAEMVGELPRTGSEMVWAGGLCLTVIGIGIYFYIICCEFYPAFFEVFQQ